MFPSFIARVLFVLLWLGVACSSLATPATMQILTSIKPLALIAQEVVGERGEVSVLLPVAASPHDYPLKVSDMRRLRQTDLFLWVGPELETFLQRPLANLPSEKLFSVYHLPGLHWPDQLSEAQVEVGREEENDHHHHDQDPHLWLDPRNATLIARALAKKLAQQQPADAAVYSANAERFAQQNHELDQRITEQLKPVKRQGFAVYHEGYLHFVKRYQLRQLGYVTYAPERRPGARHLHQLRQSLQGEARCLFVEPFYDPHNAQQLSEELGLRIGVLDPIGGEHTESYNELIEAMAEAFLTCLTQN